MLQAHASGSQIYTCQQAADGKYAWTLKAPDAELRDEKGQVVGKHYAGPTWKHNDGSEVTGKAAARAESPDADSIPWLLVTATGHSGEGALSRVSSIQRIHTHGGQPPSATDCNAAKQNAEAKSSYTADYYFSRQRNEPVSTPEIERRASARIARGPSFESQNDRAKASEYNG